MQRVSRGIPTGGQFDREAKAEADITLFDIEATAPPESRPRMKDDLRAAETGMHAIGFNDDQVECDNCGRDELKGTVVIADADGDIVYRMGTTCAGNYLSQKITKPGALKIERNRRSEVGGDLRRAMRDIDRGLFSSASGYLDDAWKRGLHLPEEKATYARHRLAIEQGRARLHHRYAVSIEGRAPVEVDGLSGARTVRDTYRRKVDMLKMVDGQWAHLDDTPPPAPNINITDALTNVLVDHPEDRGVLAHSVREAIMKSRRTVSSPRKAVEELVTAAQREPRTPLLESLEKVLAADARPARRGRV